MGVNSVPRVKKNMQYDIVLSSFYIKKKMYIIITMLRNPTHNIII